MTRNLLFGIALVGLLAGGTLRAQAPRPEFTPSAGFDGRTEGNGTLRLLGKSRPFHVESYGFDRPDGTTQLDQTITAVGKAPRNRSFVIAAAGPQRYAGTLTGAAGPVTMRTDGDRLTLRYRAKGPLVVRQTLVLRPDERTIDNSGRVTLLGLPVGRLHETITRKP